MKKGNKFFYGWWIVFVCAIVSFTMSWTIFGVVLKDLMEQFNSGRGVVSLAQSISVLSGGAAGIVAGKLLTRYRPRIFILWGSVLNGLCFLLLSLSPSLWYFYVFSFIAGVAVGFNGVISLFTLLSKWFTRKWGTAVGIAQAGGFVGLMAITPLLGFIAENYGWRLAYVFSGSLVLILNIPLILFVTKDSPQSLGLLPDGDRPADITKTINSRPPEESNIAQSSKIVSNTGLASLIKSRSLWLICFSFAFIGIGYSVVVNHEVSFMTDMNVSATVAASALGFTVGLTAIASLVSGWLADKLSSRYVLILFTLIAIAGMLVLLRADTMSKIWFFVILFGIGVGASGTLLPIITRDIFGSADFSALFGFTNIFFVIGCAAGAPLAGFMFDVTGSYHAIFVIVTTIFIGSILAIYFAFGAAPKPLLRHPALKEIK